MTLLNPLSESHEETATVKPHGGPRYMIYEQTEMKILSEEQTKNNF